MLSRRKDLAQRVLGAVDLAIDFATLGEYGLEPVPADGSCRERPGHATGWEALATVRPRTVCYSRSRRRRWRRPSRRSSLPSRASRAVSGIAGDAERGAMNRS